MKRYSIRSDRVTHENIDGEVIAVLFESGIYYSLSDSAALIWGQLVNGATPGMIAARFADRTDDAETQITSFLDQLVSEGLVEVEEQVEEVAFASGDTQWTPPRFERYSDMSDLIMADPIHDVDEMGWPSLRDPEGDSGK